MDAAGQAGIEAAHRAHDVDALEFVRTVLLEDRRVLHRVLVRTRRAVNVARVRVPRRRRIRMVVGDLAVADDQVMRQDAAHGFVETAADRFVGHFERCERCGASGVHFRQRFLDEVERASGRRKPGSKCARGRVRLRCSISESSIRTRLRVSVAVFGRSNLHAVIAGRFDVANIHQTCERRRPESRDRAAAGIQRQMIAGALVEPARRHHPGVFAGEVALLRSRNRRLIPRMPPIDRIAERIVLDEYFRRFPQSS